MIPVLEHIPSGCAAAGIMNKSGIRISGDAIMDMMSVMHSRSNGLGGGFAAYGIYPETPDNYCLHIMFDTESAKREVDSLIEENFIVERQEKIPTKIIKEIKDPPLLWRYFVLPKPEKLVAKNVHADDFVVKLVMLINTRIPGSYVNSSGKNMGVFKGVGYPEDIGKFFMLEKYGAYIWTAHGRFPTNTPGWWAGAHPFSILDWTVVHNGEISSYGINKRFLETYGYECVLLTDTEVIAYTFDLLVRKHGLPLDIACNVVASKFWKDIELMPEEEKKLHTALRMTYGNLLLNGPFAIIVATNNYMMGLNDRIKLRPLVYGKKGEFSYLASEESSIRKVESNLEDVYSLVAGKPLKVEVNKDVCA